MLVTYSYLDSLKPSQFTHLTRLNQFSNFNIIYKNSYNSNSTFFACFKNVQIKMLYQNSRTYSIKISHINVCVKHTQTKLPLLRILWCTLSLSLSAHTGAALDHFERGGGGGGQTAFVKHPLICTGQNSSCTHPHVSCTVLVTHHSTSIHPKTYKCTYICTWMCWNMAITFPPAMLSHIMISVKRSETSQFFHLQCYTKSKSLLISLPFVSKTV